MREVLSTLFKRSTLTFMSIVLALSTLTPVMSAPTAKAAVNGPFSVQTVCSGENVVLNVGLVEDLPWWFFGGDVFYKTPYGNSGKQWLGVNDPDTWTLQTNLIGVDSVEASAEVRDPLFGSLIKKYTVNIDAANCDATAPVVAINSPSENVTTNANVGVNVTVSDNYKLNTLSVYLNDSSGNYVTTCTSASNLDAYPTWVTSYTADCSINTSSLAEGVYTLMARAQDRKGIYALDATRTITVDKTKPVVNLVTPTSTIFSSTGTIMSVQATDNFAVNKVVANIYKEDGTLYKSTQSTAPAGANDYTHSVNLGTVMNGALLPEGKYYVKYNATDLAGNLAQTKTFNFTVDNTAPTVTVKSAPDTAGNFALGIYSKVSFKLFDAKQIDKLTLNGVEKNLTNNNWSDLNGVKPGLFGATEGSNTLVVYDVAGNTTTVNFVLDTIAPAMPAHEFPANNAFININDFWFEWTDANDAVSYETQYSQNPAVGVDGAFTNVQWTGDYQNIQPTDSKARSVGANGTWYWQVRSVDAAGNKSAWTNPWKLTIDMVAPIAKISNPTNNGLTNGIVVLEGEVTDVNPMNSHFRIEGPNGYLKTDTKSNGLSLHTLAWNTVGLEDGEYTIYFETRDKAQNKDGSRNNLGPSVDKVVVTVDNTNPVVTLIDFAAIANVITPNITADDANLPLTYAWTAADADSGANVVISDASVLMPEFTVNVDGTYGFNLVVTDATGNSTTQLFTFTYTTPIEPEQPVVVPATTNNTGNNGGFTNVGLNEGDGEDVLGESETQQGSQPSGEESESGEVLGTATENNDNAWAPFGIVWYWWLLILAALAVLARLFVVVRRRLAEN